MRAAKAYKTESGMFQLVPLFKTENPTRLTDDKSLVNLQTVDLDDYELVWQYYMEDLWRYVPPRYQDYPFLKETESIRMILSKKIESTLSKPLIYDEAEGDFLNETLLPFDETKRNRYLASKIREHLNAVGYDLSRDTESLITQVLKIDGDRYQNGLI